MVVVLLVKSLFGVCGSSLVSSVSDQFPTEAFWEAENNDFIGPLPLSGLLVSA